MILAKLKYKRIDNKIVITETLSFIEESYVRKVLKRDDGTEYGILIVFNKYSVTFTILPHYPLTDTLCIGTKVGTLFGENTDLRNNVYDSKFEDYLEIHCPVVIRRTYNKRTKVHTIVFTDKLRNN